MKMFLSSSKTKRCKEEKRLFFLFLNSDVSSGATAAIMWSWGSEMACQEWQNRNSKKKKRKSGLLVVALKLWIGLARSYSNLTFNIWKINPFIYWIIVTWIWCIWKSDTFEDTINISVPFCENSSKWETHWFIFYASSPHFWVLPFCRWQWSVAH